MLLPAFVAADERTALQASWDQLETECATELDRQRITAEKAKELHERIETFKKVSLYWWWHATCGPVLCLVL